MAVVTNPDETVLRLPVTSQRHLRSRSDRKLWLGNDPAPCPNDGVTLTRPNPTYPVAIWAVEADATPSNVIVCNAEGLVAARGTISLVGSEEKDDEWGPWQ